MIYISLHDHLNAFVLGVSIELGGKYEWLLWWKGYDCPSIYPAPVSVRSVDMPSIHDVLLSHSFPCSPLVPDIPITLYFFLRPLFFSFFLLPKLPFNNIRSIDSSVQQTMGGWVDAFCCSSLLPSFVHFRLLSSMDVIYSIVSNRLLLFIFSFSPLVIAHVNWKGVTNCK